MARKDGATDPKASSKQAVEELKEVHKWAKASAATAEAGFADVQAALSKVQAALQQPSPAAITQCLQWAIGHVEQVVFVSELDTSTLVPEDVAPELYHILMAFLRRRGVFLSPGWTPYRVECTDALLADYHEHLVECIHGLTGSRPRLVKLADGQVALFHGAFDEADDASTKIVSARLALAGKPKPPAPVAPPVAAKAEPAPAPDAAAYTAAAAVAEYMKTHVEMKVMSVEMTNDDTRGVMNLAPKADDGRIMPIHIGEAEAQPLQRHTSRRSAEPAPAARPMTHDLLANAITACMGRVALITLDDMRGSTYFARVHLVVGGTGAAAATICYAETVAIDARPSDAINLAVRCGAPVYASKALLELKARKV